MMEDEINFQSKYVQCKGLTLTPTEVNGKTITDPQRHMTGLKFTMRILASECLKLQCLCCTKVRLCIELNIV